MSDIGLNGPRPATPPRGLRDRLLALVGSRGFQKWAARFPLTRGVTRREGEAMFDIIQGFVASQSLMALIELGIFDALADGSLPVDVIARRAGVPEARMIVLLRAGVALSLLRWRGDEIALSRRGAALRGVPGLADMVRHHRVLYRDLEDPAAFYRGTTTPELASFWPYVFGAGAAEDPDTAARYSRLMADSQALVADETLARLDLSGVTHLMDVGGGTGAFLVEALRAKPGLTATLFDLPAVVPGATSRIDAEGLGGRITIAPGSFQDGELPKGADAISLVRVLYDHADGTVRTLLARVFEALPPGGRLIVSEPMLGSVAGDVYFAAYTLAMGTGRTRSKAEISAHLEAVGFERLQDVTTARPFVTSVLTARKPEV